LTFNFDNLAIHAGQDVDPAADARAIPICQNTSYVFNPAVSAANLVGLKEQGCIYFRIMKPTLGVLEERLARPDLSDQGAYLFGEYRSRPLQRKKRRFFIHSRGAAAAGPGRTIGASQEQATAGGRK